MPQPSRLPTFLGALIQTAYLPTEVPPAVTTRNFAHFCARNYKTIASQKVRLLGLSTMPAPFTAPRSNNFRRPLSVVHPLAQLSTSLILTQNRRKIKEIISSSGISLYRTDEDLPRHRAFSGLDFRRNEVLQPRIASQCPFILRADISRFFYTIYTHSIAWSVLGKEAVKELIRTRSPKLRAHWSDELDRALQSCQSRETFGIPVGPDTSRVVAEILLAGVQRDKALAPHLDGRPASRLVDDFLIGFPDAQSAQAALYALRAALWKYNLQLNDEKTTISASRTLFREQWKVDIEGMALSKFDSIAQEKDIYRLMDNTFYYCTQTRDGRPATWACRRLSEIPNIADNLSLILDTLFRLSRDFPSCLQHVVSFLINNRDGCDTAREQITAWVKNMLTTHYPQNHHAEVCWCLVVCGVFGIVVEETDLSANQAVPNPIVFALLGLLRERRMVSFSLSRWPWRSEFRSSGIYSEHWLPLYESVRRKWTADKQLIAEIRADPLFAEMLDQGVTFLDDRIFFAQKLDLPRRVFGPIRDRGRLAKKEARTRQARSRRRVGRLMFGYEE